LRWEIENGEKVRLTATPKKIRQEKINLSDIARRYLGRNAYLEKICHQLLNFLSKEGTIRKLHRCKECESFFIARTLRRQEFCSDRCRLTWNNRRRIESGEHKEYKRRRKESGKATPSYWE
jgi:hypothetical protein